MNLLEKDRGVSWQKEFFSIPNCLSYLRILLLPLFVWLYFGGEQGEINIPALLVIALSGITDSLDGIIARKCHMITEWGKILDPIADKLTQLTVACCLGIKHPLVFVLFLVMAVKELVTGITTLVKLRQGLRIDSARWYGKAATAGFYAAIILILGFGEFLPGSVSNACILLTCLLMIYAFIRYMLLLLELGK